MFCKNCGKQLKEGDKFCPDCGAPVAARPVPPAPNRVPTNGKQSAFRKFCGDCARRRKESPYNEVGQAFTIAHILTIICCIAVIIALFLPNRSSGYHGYLEDWEIEKSPTIAKTVIQKFKTMDEISSYYYPDEHDKAAYSAFFTFFLTLMLATSTSLCFGFTLEKKDRSAVNISPMMLIMAGLLVWQCGGGLKGTGYITLLVGSLGALVFSVAGFMLNQNKR